ncbi:MAG: hypothetical protein J0I99_10900 [Devosia sp.]|uniref:hypothetical protein n=1 Tax=Devosia sp. TaxID=1871048 RepID=UPI001AC05A94|nr:hypothetical protein [Devosia sp.]MBN9316238.1 hypothetical protein [Devosia sp.]
MTEAPRPLTANPSLLWLPAVAGLAALVGVLALLPAVLLLASLAGALSMQPTVELSFLAVPTTAVGLFFVVVAAAILADLRLPRPVLSIDDAGVFDRRVTDGPIPWSAVEDVSLAPGGGAMQLVLRAPMDTRLSPCRAGTIGLRTDMPGLALIPIRGMDRPAAGLAAAMLDFARANGAIAELEAEAP